MRHPCAFLAGSSQEHQSKKDKLGEEQATSAGEQSGDAEEANGKDAPKSENDKKKKNLGMTRYKKPKK